MLFGAIGQFAIGQFSPPASEPPEPPASGDNTETVHVSLIFSKTKIQLDATFKNGGVAQDPSGGVTFEYRLGRDGAIKTATVTNIATGVYRVEVTPDEAKDIFYRFASTGDITISHEGRKRIERGWFADQDRTTDYV